MWVGGPLRKHLTRKACGLGDACHLSTSPFLLQVRSLALRSIAKRFPHYAPTSIFVLAEALSFVARLVRQFRPRVDYILKCRRETQAQYDNGMQPEFSPSTRAIREGDWKCAAMPAAIADRRVEITGPVERKMIINALNCGAKMFMVSQNEPKVFQVF